MAGTEEVVDVIFVAEAVVFIVSSYVTGNDDYHDEGVNDKI